MNASIAATGTEDSLARFQRDVLPYAPDFVILATSLWNEGFAQNPNTIADQYVRNTQQLVGMVESLGALPVVVGPYPNSAATPAQPSQPASTATPSA